MKSLFISTILACAAASSFAQVTGWTLTSVATPAKTTAGYIYHTYAFGVHDTAGKRTNVTAGLRFICSTIPEETGAPPILAVFWQGALPMDPTPVNVSISVDGRSYDDAEWRRDGTALYTPLGTGMPWMSILKQSKAIKLSWKDSVGTQSEVAFPLEGFDLSRFNTLCKTRL